MSPTPYTFRERIQNAAESAWYGLTYWPKPTGVYRKRAWPEAGLVGRGTDEEPFALVIRHGEHTRGRDLFFHVVDWVDDHTGHKICSTRWFGRLLADTTGNGEEIGRIPLTAEQVRAIDPDNWHLPENQDDDEEKQ